jgi:hypothetical protein
MGKDLNGSKESNDNAKVINLHWYQYQNELYVLNEVLKDVGRILVPYVTNINYILMSLFNKSPEVGVSTKDIDNLKLIGASLIKIVDSLNRIVLSVNNAAEQMKADGHVQNETLHYKLPVIYEIIKELEDIAMQTNILALSKVFVVSETDDEDLAMAVKDLQDLAAESIKVTRYVSDLIKKDVLEEESK